MDRMDDEHFELLADVASLYYEEGLTQQEISEQLQYSRSRISRLLTEAQKTGVVEIQVHHPLARNRALESRLQEVFHLKAARVCKSCGDTYDGMLKRVGALAARLAAQHMRENITVGLSWGAALAEMANAFRHQHYSGARVVQLVGTVGSVDPTTDGPGLVRRFAAKLDGRAYTLAAPWLIDNKLVRDALLEDRRLRETLNQARYVDLAIVGIGTIIPELSSLVRAGYLTTEQALHLVSVGIVGDICGEQFDIHGNLIEIPLTGYVFGIPVTLLREVPLVIGVAGGSEKSSAILGGLRSGLVNALVTDETAAAAILEKVHTT
jgi:DNA-binding transcriptional regulator LsrR (DeoR family)